jgi:hypothetical protein
MRPPPIGTSAQSTTMVIPHIIRCRKICWQVCNPLLPLPFIAATIATCDSRRLEGYATFHALQLPALAVCLLSCLVPTNLSLVLEYLHSFIHPTTSVVALASKSWSFTQALGLDWNTSGVQEPPVHTIAIPPNCAKHLQLPWPELRCAGCSSSSSLPSSSLQSSHAAPRLCHETYVRAPQYPTRSAKRII